MQGIAGTRSLQWTRSGLRSRESATDGRLRFQRENQERPASRLIDVSGFKAAEIAFFGDVGVDQKFPMGTPATFGEREFDEVVVGVENEQQCGVSPALHDAGRLGASVDQHAETAHLLVRPMFGLHLVAVSVDPSQVFYAEFFRELAR